MAGKQRFTAEQVRDALNLHNALVAPTAAYLRCHPSTVRNYIDRYATVREAFEEHRETLKDAIVNEWLVLLRDRAHRDHWDAVKYGLRTYCADRGFSDKIILTGPDGGAIQHEHDHKHTVDDDREQRFERLFAELDAYRAQPDDPDGGSDTGQPVHPNGTTS